MNRKGHVRLAGAVFAHVLRLFVEAGVDRVVFVPRDETTRTGILSVHQPVVNAWYVFLADMPRPRVLVTLSIRIHFKHVPNQLPGYRSARPTLPQEIPRFALLECLCVLLDTVGNFNIYLPISRRFQFLVGQVLHRHLRVLLCIEIVVFCGESCYVAFRHGRNCWHCFSSAETPHN